MMEPHRAHEGAGLDLWHSSTGKGIMPFHPPRHHGLGGGQEAMPDGRDIAKELCRGATRLLRQQGFATLAEVPLANGRRADIMALGRDGEIRIIAVSYTHL